MIQYRHTDNVPVISLCSSSYSFAFLLFWDYSEYTWSSNSEISHFPKAEKRNLQIHTTKERIIFQRHICFECLLAVEVTQAIKITLQKSLFLATSYVPDTLFCLQQSQKFHTCNQTLHRLLALCLAETVHCGTTVGTTWT